MAMVAVGAVSACSDDEGGSVLPVAGAGGAAGDAGAGGDGAGGDALGGAPGTAGTGGTAGATNTGGVGGSAVVPPTPALPANAATVACPTQITGALEASDARQTGRHSRIAPVSACGAAKTYPSNTADPTNPHLFDVYRFANPSASAACFSFTLTEGGAVVVEDGGVDAGPDASKPSASNPDASNPNPSNPDPSNPDGDAGTDAGGVGGLAAPGAGIAPPRYMTAYGTFYPTDLGREFLGDVGDVLVAPQTMAITVPAGETVDVVIYAIDVAPGGVGSYTLTCSAE